MDALVLSPCSDSKQYGPAVDCEGVDNQAREELVQRYPKMVAPASEMYTGREHRHVRSAVEQLRESATVDWYIISAGFGLLQEDTLIPSYDCGFSNIKSIRARADRAGHDIEELTNNETIRMMGREKRIPQDFRQIFNNEYDLLFVVLGKSYLLSVADALTEIPDRTTAIAFASKGSKQFISDCVWVPATETERQTLETTWLELRSMQFSNLVSKLDTEMLQQLQHHPQSGKELL